MNLIQKIDEAVRKLKAGTFTGAVVPLLEQAKEALQFQSANIKQVELDNTKAVYDAYRELHKKLQDIGRAYCEARVPNAQVIYLDKWSLYGQRGEDEPRINLELSYRRTKVEDGEDEHSPDGYDGTGQGYVSRRFNCLIPAEWLWLPEEKHAGIVLAGLKAELERTEKRAQQQLEAIPKRREELDALHSRLIDTDAHAVKLRERIKALAGEELVQ